MYTDGAHKAMTIYAIEGPSGAGKTSLVQGQDATVTKFYKQWPRVMNKEQAVFYSSLADYEVLLYAVTFQQPVYSDRFLIGRWVYRAFEVGHLDPLWYQQMQTSLKVLRTAVATEYMQRTGDRNYPTQPTIDLMVLLPDIDQVAHQREASGKSYPFDLDFEYQLYDLIARRLYSYPFDNMKVTII